MTEIQTDTAGMALALLVGAALGIVFFSGLLWTIRRALASNQAGLWFSGSFLVRSAIVVTGFYFAGRGDWHRMAACLVGFLCARLIVVRSTRLREARPMEGR